jgi:uncharacterized protein (UPF0332 family)
VTWKQLLADARVEPHVPGRQETHDLLQAAARNLRDAALKGLSADNAFGLAYEAAFLLAKAVIACAGYRVRGLGAHHTTFVALEVAVGSSISQAATYFDRCRRKRHELSYDAAGVASESEVEELIEEVKRFQSTVEDWIVKNHPALA